MRIVAGLMTMAIAAMLSVIPHAQDVQTAGNDGEWGKFDVGSQIIHIELKGVDGERRPMDVILLYPADKQAYRKSNARTVYNQRLNGVTLDPAKWDPLSWTVVSERAKDDVPIDRSGPGFPLILFSHAAQGQPM